MRPRQLSLCDTLLRLAEPPLLLEPKWSEEIIRETIRTLKLKLGWPRSLTAHLETELRDHFSDAWISGHEALITQMPNDEKDRHVLAAAVHGRSPIIVTLNLRHFRPEHLEPWGDRRTAPSIVPRGDVPPGAIARSGEIGATGRRPRS
jgi:hypothetical protein